MKTLLVVIFLMMNIACAETVIGGGANIKDVVKVSTILSNPDKYLEKEVTVSGTVVKVCEHSGCKMMIASDKKYQQIVIRAQEGKMFFPLSARGKKAIAKGVLRRSKKGDDHKDCDEKYTYAVQATGAVIL